MKQTKIFYGLLAVASLQFGAVGLLKIGQFPPLYAQLAELHVSAKLGLLIGCAEVLGVIGLWLPRTRGGALLGLLYLAISAVAVHIGAGVDLSKAIPAFFSMGILSVLLYLHSPRSVAGVINPVK